jgi:hypothetical protein
MWKTIVVEVQSTWYGTVLEVRLPAGIVNKWYPGTSIITKYWNPPTGNK